MCVDDGRYKIPVFQDKFKPGFKYFLQRLFTVVIITITVVIFFDSFYKLHAEYIRFNRNNDATREVLAWISENTPINSIFFDLVMHNFYINAQRAKFVSFKHMPNLAPDIIEWYEHIKMINGNRTPKITGFKVQKELRAKFYKLEEYQIKHIAEAYDIDYYLGHMNQKFEFKPEYSNSEYTLYSLNGKNK